MARGDYPSLKGYLNQRVLEPAYKRPPIWQGGCLLSPLVLFGLGSLLASWTGAAVATFLTLFVGIPAWTAVIALLNHLIEQPRNDNERRAVARLEIARRLKNEARRKSKSDPTMLTLMDAIARSYGRIRAAFGHPVWTESGAGHWREWRERTELASASAMDQALDQAGIFLYNPQAPPKSKLENLLDFDFEDDDDDDDEERFRTRAFLPPQLPGSYAGLYRLAVDLKKLSVEVERQTNELATAGLNLSVPPSSERIRDVLEDLEQLRQAQSELDSGPDSLSARG